MRKTRKVVGFGLILGIGLTTLLSAPASADIHVFWKTAVCPVFGNKAALASVPGVMETAYTNKDGINASVGGVYCAPQFGFLPQVEPSKPNVVTNANIGPIENEQRAFPCIICQYPNKVTLLAQGMPSIPVGIACSIMGVLGTLGLIRLRSRQAG